MKGELLGYAAIIAVLITGTAMLIYVSQAEPVSTSVASKEGMLTSFGSFNHFFLKTFNQSIEFISQRAAYDLGMNGGFPPGSSDTWNYYYPDITVLKENLNEKIKENLPQFYKKGNKTVTLKGSNIDVMPQTPFIGSTYFDVLGEANFSIYDDSIRTTTFLDFNINSIAYSSYFRLLYVGREILTNSTFNSSLNDANALLRNLTDPTINGNRFNGLDFDIVPVNGFLYITIKDLCPGETYCLAPLNSQETGITMNEEQTHYDYLELKFRIQSNQTGLTPPSFDFDLSIIPNNDFVNVGDTAYATVSVMKLGSLDKIANLSSTVVNEATGLTEPTIAVSFNPNDQEPSFNSQMKIETTSLTPAGTYNITVNGVNDTLTRSANYILTVNPSLTFSIDVNPSSGTVVRGSNIQATVNVNRTSGVDRQVYLELISPEPTITAAFTPNSQLTNFTSIMTIYTTSATPESSLGYTLTVKGTGGGSTATHTYNLIVELPFNFELFDSGDKSVDKGSNVAEQIKVHKTQGTAQPVSLKYSIISLTTHSPGNFNISVNWGNNPCTPNGAGDLCFVDMTFVTNQYTPLDTYQITVYGNTTSGMPSPLPETVFNLKVTSPPSFEFYVDLSEYNNSDNAALSGYGQTSVGVTVVNTIGSGSVGLAYLITNEFGQTSPNNFYISVSPMGSGTTPLTTTMNITTDYTKTYDTYYNITIIATEVGNPSNNDSISYQFYVKNYLSDYNWVNLSSNYCYSNEYPPQLYGKAAGLLSSRSCSSGQSCNAFGDSITTSDNPPTIPPSDPSGCWAYNYANGGDVSSISVGSSYQLSYPHDYIWANDTSTNKFYAAECAIWNNLQGYYNVYQLPMGLLSASVWGVENDTVNDWVNNKEKPYPNNDSLIFVPPGSSILRRVWCGDTNTHCLLCYGNNTGVHWWSKWYVCRGKIAGPDVGISLPKDKVGSWTCDISGNWTP